MIEMLLMKVLHMCSLLMMGKTGMVVFLTPVNDIDFPSISGSNNYVVIVITHRFVTLGKGQKKPR